MTVAKMHSILFVATIVRGSTDWKPFLENVDARLRTRKGFVRLAENVWLLDLTVSAAPLGLLVYQAETLEIPYGLLPFAEAPQWLPASYNPTTIQDRNG
jgi:hypothetical protein